MLHEAGLIGDRSTETDAYVRVVSLRYLLLRTHEWNDEVIERLREELRRPTSRERHLRRTACARTSRRPALAAPAQDLRVRLSPLDGSKRWSLRGVHPQLRLLALA